MLFTHTLERKQRIERPLAEVFAFFAEAANLEAITPSFLRFRMITPPPVIMSVGTRIEYEISLLGLPMRWRSLISTWEPGVRFVDEQELGPYALWHHTHDFEADGEHATIVRDVVRYREPFGPLGAIAHVLFVKRTLRAIFDHRRIATQRLLEAAQPSSRKQNEPADFERPGHDLR